MAEGWTHADGVIGHVLIGSGALANAALAEDASQFVVTEAKLFSRLSPGVRNASDYDQAARNVACIAEVLCRAKRAPAELSSLGFFVLAPREQIGDRVFTRELSLASIRDKVAARVEGYASPDREIKEKWFQDWFLPTLSRAKIDCMPWETIVEYIRDRDAVFGAELSEYYGACLEFNRLQKAPADGDPPPAVPV